MSSVTVSLPVSFGPEINIGKRGLGCVSVLLISTCYESGSDCILAKTNMVIWALHFGKDTNKCDRWHSHVLS